MDKVLLNKQESYLLNAMEALNKPSQLGSDAGLGSRLHKGQIEVLKPLFVDTEVDTVFLSCGRKFGKTEAAMYALWRFALTHPNGACYYVAPENEHGRKLVWDTNRLQKFLGPLDKNGRNKYIKRINTREMKITLRNDAFIQVIGSENWQVANGLTPSFAVYDEFKVFHPKWHTEFNPNRLAKNAPLLIIGTPPKIGDKNAEEYFKVQEDCKTDDLSYWFRRSSYENPVIQQKTIDREIEKLRGRGEEDVVQREYFARIVAGGNRAIFPMLSEDHVFPHEQLLDEIKHDIKKLEWYCVVDPATTTCFAGLIIAVNPYNKTVYVFDEVYEKNQHNTSVRMIYPKLVSMMHTYYPNSSIIEDWTKVYDEAAAWFTNEVLNQYGTYFIPTQKHISKKENGLSLIKDMLIYKTIKISSKCENLYNEMLNYAKDDKGNIPKKNDHCIDCLRYFLHANNYSMIEALEIRALETGADADKKDMRRRRFRRFEDEQDLSRDWTKVIDKEYDL